MLGQYEHLYLGFRVLHSCNHLLRQLSDVLCLGILKDSQVAFNTLRTQKVSPLATSGPGGGGMQSGGAMHSAHEGTHLQFGVESRELLHRR